MKNARRFLPCLLASTVGAWSACCTQPPLSSVDAGTDAGGDAGQGDGGPGDAGHADAGHPDGGSAVDGGFSTPIQHLVILVMENHTFDNLFSGFPGAETASHIPGPDGGFDAPACPDSLSRDLCHAHGCALQDWDDGGMDGWESVAGSDMNGDELAFCQYSQAQIPGLWSLAQNYALADHFHASMLGPSFPGHMFTLAAQAGWAIENPTQAGASQLLWGCDDAAGVAVHVLEDGGCTQADPAPCFTIPSSPDVLQPGQTWKFYGTGVGFGSFNIVWSMFDAIQPIRYGPNWGNVIPDQQFDTDVAAGTLPTVSWLVDESIYSGHPPLSMCASVTWITTRVNEIINNPALYANTAVVIVWDDFGGFYDHVPPPAQYGCEGNQPYGLGFRLPAIIVSPWVKQGVFHGVTEQASLVRLIEELFGTPESVGSLATQDPAARDRAAGSLLSAFDFTQKPLAAAPAPTACP